MLLLATAISFAYCLILNAFAESLMQTEISWKLFFFINNMTRESVSSDFLIYGVGLNSRIIVII